VLLDCANQCHDDNIAFLSKAIRELAGAPDLLYPTKDVSFAHPVYRNIAVPKGAHHL
jgi:hypothetical protein